MLVALDYDGTYTEAPDLWDAFIKLFRMNGHSVIIATMRGEEEGNEIKEVLEHKVDRIVFTSRKAKYVYLMERGIYPDIWIDDTPRWLFMDG